MQCPGMPCGPCLPKVWYGCETESGNARVKKQIKRGRRHSSKTCISIVTERGAEERGAAECLSPSSRLP